MYVYPPHAHTYACSLGRPGDGLDLVELEFAESVSY